jgi:hypothetical protein
VGGAVCPPGQVAVDIGHETGPDSAAPAAAFAKPADRYTWAKTYHFGVYTLESSSAWLSAPLCTTTLPPLLEKGGQAALAAAAAAAAGARKERGVKADIFGPFTTEGGVGCRRRPRRGCFLRGEAYVARRWVDEIVAPQQSPRSASP